MFSIPRAALVGSFSVLALAGGVAAFSVFPTLRSWLPFGSVTEVEAQEGVVGETVGNPTLSNFSPELFFNVPSTFNKLLTAAVLAVEGEATFGGAVQFNDAVTFAQDVIIDGQLTLRQNITGNNIDIDLQSGRVIASNLVYSVTAGSGVAVSGDQDLVVENTDKGSDQKIFKKIKVGDSALEADNNSDEVRFSAGNGISLSLSGDEITIASSNVSGWTRSRSGVVALVTASDKVGIGTSSPTNTVEIASGVSGLSGLTFTNLTSSSAAGVGGGKVLTVDSGGKVVLVQDQTNETPTAEDVLPTSDNGGTLYFNGLNWVSSTNLFHDGGKVGISTTDPQARLQVNTNSASMRGLVIQGYTGQTSNLQEWRNSDGTPLSYIDSTGSFNGSFTGDLNGTVTGTLNPGFTTGAIAFQGASGLNGDATNFFWDNSNKRLGIGTATPSYALDVTGSIQTSDRVYSNMIESRGTGTHQSIALATNGGITLGTSAMSGNGNTYYGSHAFRGSGTFRVFDYYQTTLPILSINQGNTLRRAGINTTTPDRSFEINSSDGNNLRLTYNDADGGATNYADFAMSSSGDLTITPSGSDANIVGNLAISGSTTLGDATGDTLTINSTAVSTPNNLNFDSNTLFVDAANDRVGIGTSGPGAKLEVQGGALYSESFSSTASNESRGLVVRSGNGNRVGAFYGYDNETLQINSLRSGGILFGAGSSGGLMKLAASGYLGIGTTSPTALLHAATTSTTFPTNGIGYFDWSPTSATTTTGDLFSLNIGANGTVGKLFNVKNNGSSVFSVSQAQITHNVPTQFLAAGDVSFGYDLLLTNATASYLRSYAPMYLEAGDSTGNLDLTLRTWGVGDVIADMGGNFQLQSADPALVFNTATATDTDFWMGVIEDADGVDDDLLQFGKGTVVGTTPYMTMTSAGNVGIGTASPGKQLDIVANANNAFRISRDTNPAHYFEVRTGDWGSGAGASIIAPSLSIGNGITTFAGFRNNGSLIIGATSGSSRLHVQGAGDTSATTALNVTNSAGISALFVRDDGNVGIGTTDPAASLEIGSGQVLLADGTNSLPSISFSSSSGWGLNKSSGAMSLVTGGSARLTVITGAHPLVRVSNSLAIASSAGGATDLALVREAENILGLKNSVSGQTFRVFNTTDTTSGYAPGAGTNYEYVDMGWSSNSFRLQTVAGGTGAVRNLLLQPSGGAVAIGTTDPGSNKLYVAGDLEVTGACTGCSSDSRLKENVQTISGSVLTKLLTLKGVTFDWSDAEKARTRPGRQIGVIAQDVEKVFPELVGTDSRGYKFVRYDHLIAPTIEAIREQQTQLISLNGQVLQVNSTLSTLQVNSNGSLTPSPDEQLATRVAALEQQVADLTAGKTVNEQGQFEATGLIPGIARWLNDSWTFLASVVFTRSAKFEETATFDKPLAQATDAVGSVVIPSATDSARITFANKYDRAPFVTLTPVSRTVAGYVVDEVSAEGFTIRLSQKPEQEVMFNWMAVMSSVAEAPAGLPGVMGVQTVSSDISSVSQDGTVETPIIPVSVPLASPSPSPASLFEATDPTTPTSSGAAEIEL